MTTKDASLPQEQSTEEMSPTVELLPVEFQELVTVKDEEMDFTHVEEEQLNSAQRFVGMDMKVENCGSLVFWDSDAIPETKVSLSKQDAYEEIPPEQELIIQRLEKDDAWECGGTLERQQRIPKKDKLALFLEVLLGLEGGKRSMDVSVTNHMAEAEKRISREARRRKSSLAGETE
ncbi:Zinc finger protein 180 [Camelus dromedarius]|uniref:Zinc finger protein 180 n=1 Tax=Camelus dromedarius TaxID=9838 RepID=A0A5N4CWG1_CAMDR|nr:Zinc finger protein 180 [Camelus dromedarius]